MDENIPWGFGRWAALVAGAVATAAVTFVVDALVVFAQSGTCGEVGTSDDIQFGRLLLFGILVVTAGIWGLTVLRSSRQAAVAVGAAIAVLPALVFALRGLSDHAWVGSFCLF